MILQPPTSPIGPPTTKRPGPPALDKSLALALCAAINREIREHPEKGKELNSDSMALRIINRGLELQGSGQRIVLQLDARDKSTIEAWLLTPKKNAGT